jgi:hypothetical protein
MKFRVFLTSALLASAATFAHADQTEDLNAFALVLSIPIYAEHCGVALDETVSGNVYAKIDEMKSAMGLSDEQVAGFQSQMKEQFSANADCTEGSSDRTNFESTIKAYGAQ